MNGISASLASRGLVHTDELPARTRTALSNFLRDLDRWRQLSAVTPHPQLLETILEESGYTDMLRADKTPTSQTRLENLKELVQSMGAFDDLGAYLEHVSLVMDLDRDAGDDAVQIMTLHSAKGLEFPLVFLPGWEEGVFPSQRSMDEKGDKGLEEERRLAYVGITRAKEEARLSFVANRQVYGRWTSQLPSRFIDELPIAHVEAGFGDRLLRRRSGHAADRFALGRADHVRLGLLIARLAKGAKPRRAAAFPSPRAIAPSRSRARVGWWPSPNPPPALISAASGCST